MKVLIVNDAGTPGGGAELLTLGLRDGLRARGYDSRLFASSAQYGPGASQADYTCFGTTSILRTPNRVANVSAVLRLRGVLREFRPDLVHVRMFLSQLSPLILPLLRDVPAVYHATWYETICPTGLKLLPDGTGCEEPAGWACRRNGCLSRRAWPLLMLQLRLFRRWRRVFDRIVANSEALAGILRKEGLGPVEVVWNGVPVVPARPPLASPPTIAYAGRLSREKGVDVLFRAFAEVRKRVAGARLLVAGDGERNLELRRLIAALDLEAHVSMLGHLPRPALEERLAGAWVQAIPSRPPETFGLVAAEAMMRGTAVVASRIGGLAEIVDDGRSGLLVPADDADALAAALVRVLEHRALAEELGRAGRVRAIANFSEAAFVDRFVALYASLVPGGS